MIITQYIQLKPMSFRKEKKIKLTISDYYKFIDLQKNNKANKLYNKRKVNSIYFDNLALDMFHQSEEGVLPRKKIRIRWYDRQNQFNLEEKTSSVEGRFKQTKTIKNFNTISDILSFKIFDKIYGILTPSLLVSYERSYFNLNKIRITLDEKIKYKNYRNNINQKIVDPERVVELKTGIEISDDYIEKLFPFTNSRFSKYSRGLLFTEGKL